MPSFLKNKEKGQESRGSEDVTANDVIIPRLDIIQGLSPQKDKTHAKYIKGAEEGVIFNSVTGELYDSILPNL